jgi:hypothetical protein
MPRAAQALRSDQLLFHGGNYVLPVIVLLCTCKDWFCDQAVKQDIYDGIPSGCLKLLVHILPNPSIKNCGTIKHGCIAYCSHIITNKFPQLHLQYSVCRYGKDHIFRVFFGQIINIRDLGPDIFVIFC